MLEDTINRSMQTNKDIKASILSSSENRESILNPQNQTLNTSATNIPELVRYVVKICNEYNGLNRSDNSTN